MTTTIRAAAEAYAIKCGFTKESIGAETINNMGKLVYDVFHSINIRSDRWIIDPKQQNYFILEVKADSITSNHLISLTKEGFEIASVIYLPNDNDWVRLVVNKTPGEASGAKSFYNTKMIERGLALADDKTETGKEIRSILFKIALKGGHMVSYDPINVMLEMEKAGLVSVDHTGYLPTTIDHVLLTEIGRGVVAKLVEWREPSAKPAKMLR